MEEVIIDHEIGMVIIVDYVNLTEEGDPIITSMTIEEYDKYKLNSPKGRVNRGK